MADNNVPATHFGEHLMIDGYGGAASLLDDENLVTKFLIDLPISLGMKTLTEPIVVRGPDNGHKDPGGWTGFVIIAESHVSIHTFPRRGFVSVDVYSCKNGFDTQAVINYLKEMFQLQDVEVNFVKRGTRYPAANIYD